MPIAINSTNKEIHDLRMKFGCSQEIMGHIIGVTGRTISRWEDEQHEPHDLARRQVKELYKVLEKMNGIIKPGTEKEWLNAPNQALENKKPLELIEQGPEGLREVLRLLDRLEWGIAT